MQSVRDLQRFATFPRIPLPHETGLAAHSYDEAVLIERSTFAIDEVVPWPGTTVREPWQWEGVSPLVLMLPDNGRSSVMGTAKEAMIGPLSEAEDVLAEYGKGN